MRWPIAMPSKRRQHGQHRAAGVGEMQRAVAPQHHAERDGRNGEGEAEHLHQLVLGEPDGLEVRPRRNDEHAGAAGDQAGQQSDDRIEPPFMARLDGEADLRQSERGVDDQRDAEAERREPRVGAGEHAAAEPDAGGAGEHQRPQPPHQRGEMHADEHLPDVGDQRRKDHDRRRLRRRHRQREQADGDAGQAEADRAFDETGQQEGEDRQRDQAERRAERRNIHRGIVLAIR